MGLGARLCKCEIAPSPTSAIRVEKMEFLGGKLLQVPEWQREEVAKGAVVQTLALFPGNLVCIIALRDVFKREHSVQGRQRASLL